jgi:hypothetical protein
MNAATAQINKGYALTQELAWEYINDVEVMVEDQHGWSVDLEYKFTPVKKRGESLVLVEWWLVEKAETEKAVSSNTAENTNDFDEKRFNTMLREAYYEMDFDDTERDFALAEEEAKKEQERPAEEAAPVVMKAPEAPRDETPVEFITGDDVTSLLENLINL